MLLEKIILLEPKIIVISYEHSYKHIIVPLCQLEDI